MGISTGIFAFAAITKQVDLFCFVSVVCEFNSG